MRRVQLLMVASFCFFLSGCLSYASKLDIELVRRNGARVEVDDVVAIVAKTTQTYGLKPDPNTKIRLRLSEDDNQSPTLTFASFIGYSRQPGRRRLQVLVLVRKADGVPSVFIRSWDSPSDSPFVDELTFALKDAIEAEIGPGTVRFERVPDTRGFLAP